MSLEVRLEKAAKPEKWDIPADISLRNALKRSLAEDMSRLVRQHHHIVFLSRSLSLCGVGWNSGDDEEDDEIIVAEPVINFHHDSLFFDLPTLSTTDTSYSLPRERPWSLLPRCIEIL